MLLGEPGWQRLLQLNWRHFPVPKIYILRKFCHDEVSVCLEYIFLLILRGTADI